MKICHKIKTASWIEKQKNKNCPFNPKNFKIKYFSNFFNLKYFLNQKKKCLELKDCVSSTNNKNQQQKTKHFYHWLNIANEKHFIDSFNQKIEDRRSAHKISCI